MRQNEGVIYMNKEELKEAIEMYLMGQGVLETTRVDRVSTGIYGEGFVARVELKKNE